MTDVAAFAPPDVVLPTNTVLLYVAASLKESATSESLGPRLLRDEEGQDETLQLEVLIKLGVADFAWTPKYVFPMKLEPEADVPPTDVQSQQIQRLNDQVQELQEEVATLKEQMQVVLRAQAQAQSSVATRSTAIGSSASASPSRQSTTPLVRQPTNSTTKRHSVVSFTQRPSVGRYHRPAASSARAN
jgi:TolA-binding protein